MKADSIQVTCQKYRKTYKNVLTRSAKKGTIILNIKYKVFLENYFTFHCLN